MSVDLKGLRFGKLVVLEEVQRPLHGRFWLCLCDCGKKTITNSNRLTSGKTRSCGCLRANNSLVHGMYKHRLYKIWHAMRIRCNNPTNPNYRFYGAKGVAICEEWQNSFTAFRDWALSHGYADNLSIDRIDPFGNYCPDNCRWVTMQIQYKNKRNMTKRKEIKQ